MANNATELSINTEVIAKMAEIAAMEIEGVTGISKKSIDLKNAVKTKNVFKGVKVESVNGALELSIYICVKKGIYVKDIAEKVQANVKDKIQTMSGTAVTKVNVIIADISIEPEN